MSDTNAAQEGRHATAAELEDVFVGLRDMIKRLHGRVGAVEKSFDRLRQAVELEVDERRRAFEDLAREVVTRRLRVVDGLGRTAVVAEAGRVRCQTGGNEDTWIELYADDGEEAAGIFLMRAGNGAAHLDSVGAYNELKAGQPAATFSLCDHQDRVVLDLPKDLTGVRDLVAVLDTWARMTGAPWGTARDAHEGERSSIVTWTPLAPNYGKRRPGPPASVATAHGGRPLERERFPFAPLLAAVGTTAPTAVPRRAGVNASGETIRSWLTTGLTVRMADRMAIGLGRHPGEIWPEWWDLACDPDEP